MDERLLRFAELLFRGDPAAATAARDALAQPAAFVAQHGRDLGYVRPKPDWAPAPWPLLLNVAELRGFVRVVDWRAGSDEVAASVADLAPAAGLSVDLDGLAVANAEAETREFLRVLARAVPAGERLVSLDNGSDSYTLALLPVASLAEAERLAVEIGGRVDALDAEPVAAADGGGM
jgi:hypothetical protein